MLGWLGTDDARQRLTKVLGQKVAQSLKTAYGVTTVGDLVTKVPSRWLGHDRGLAITESEDGQTVTAMVEVRKIEQNPADIDPQHHFRHRKGQPPRPWVIHVGDSNATVEMPVFGQAALLRRFRVGTRLLVMGKIQFWRGNPKLQNADFLMFLDDGSPGPATGRLAKLVEAAADMDELHRLLTNPAIPMHRGRKGVAGISLALYLDRVFRQLPVQPDPLPVVPVGLPDFDTALRYLQFPQTPGGKDSAIKRLKYDEALELQLAMALRRRDQEARVAPACAPQGPSNPYALSVERGHARELMERALPFELTDGQHTVLKEVDLDLASETPMNRLLQGEVGSGKTVVAALAMARVIDSGRQCALLAPTEVLTTQHARTLSALFAAAGSDITVAALTGSMPIAEKRETLLGIVNGDVDVVVGTHALLSEGVEFFDLGFVVVDEQHRFGVRQRDRLRDRGRDGTTPHVLVMTATPIPRTIAMTVFGDLETSTLTELPGGRKTIQTVVVPNIEKPGWETRAWERIGEELAEGNRAFIVCPWIQPREEPTLPDDSLLTTAALAEEKLPDARIGILHGQLPAAEKDRIMSEFAAGDLDVLVSTTVIEVGVDVPEATIMMIRRADSFGVSQLHQLRGRVARGERIGLCFLCTPSEAGTPERERLEGVAETLDGFELAELDLRHRSHGDVLGDEQSGGGGGMGILDLTADERIIAHARREAEKMVAEDPELAERLTADITAEESEYLERG